MKAYQFKMKTNNDGTITIPDNIRQKVPEGKLITVVLEVDEEPSVKFRSTFSDISMQEFSQYISNQDAYSDDY